MQPTDSCEPHHDHIFDACKTSKLDVTNPVDLKLSCIYSRNSREKILINKAVGGRLKSHILSLCVVLTLTLRLQMPNKENCML